MKKNNTCRQSSKRRGSTRTGRLTIGMDLGDKTSRYCALDRNGEVVREGCVGTTKKAMTQVFGAMPDEAHRQSGKRLAERGYIFA